MVIDCKKPCKKKRSTMLTVEQMVDIALGTPEIGAVNFNVLHALIHVIIQQLNIQKCLVEFKGYDSERMEGIILSAKPGPILKLSEYMIDVNDNRPCPPKDKPSRQSKDEECKEEGKDGPSTRKPPCECQGKKKRSADDEKEKVDKVKEESDVEEKKKVTKKELSPEECADTEIKPEPELKKTKEFKKPCPCKAKDQSDVCADESLKAVPSSYYGSDSDGACQTIVRVEPVGERCDSWRSRPALAHESMIKLEEKVAMLQDAFEALEQMPTNEELKKRTQGTGCVSTPVKDLWQLYNLNKRVESCEGTIEKLASMIEDLVKETCNYREAMMVIAGAVDDMECADQTARNCCAALQGRSGTSPEIVTRTGQSKSEQPTVTFTDKPPEVKTETEFQYQPQAQAQAGTGAQGLAQAQAQAQAQSYAQTQSQVQPQQLNPTPCPKSQLDCSKKSASSAKTEEAPADNNPGPAVTPASGAATPAPNSAPNLVQTSTPAPGSAPEPESAPESKELRPSTTPEAPPESVAPSAKTEPPLRSATPAPLPPAPDVVPYSTNRTIPPSEMTPIGPEFYKMSSGEKFCVLKEYVDCLICQIKYLSENSPGTQILSKLCALVSMQKQLDALENEWRQLLLAFGSQGISGLIDALMLLRERSDSLEAKVAKLLADSKKSVVKLADVEAQAEYLKIVKADIDHVLDLLAGKADAALVNRKVSHDQFDAACDDFTRGLDEALEKLLQQETMWNEAMEELQKILDSKLDKVEMMPLKEFINKKLRCLQEKLKQLAQLRKDAEAAGAKSRIIRNLNCIACDAEVVMKMDNKAGYNHPAASPNKSIKPMLTYELDQVRKAMKKGHPCRAAPPQPEETSSPCPDVQKKLAGIPLTNREAVDSKMSKLAHFCNRYCGGSHTITTPQQRVTRIGHFLTEFGPQAMAIFQQECVETKPQTQPQQETENPDKPY